MIFGFSARGGEALSPSADRIRVLFADDELDVALKGKL